jgi:asparaginyl-tRNA synthetase
MQFQEDLVKYLIGAVLTEAPEEMEFLNGFVDKGLVERLTAVRDADFARVSYTNAVEILKDCGAQFEYPVYWGCDLQTEHERYLTEQHFHRPVFVTDYPRNQGFYIA